ncbi:MAG: SP family galactose:H+ symporter-like MFS transporter [Francisellaceae bacterium]|jgi:SP family galactose:H+ symporter-like MFS transporter
MARKRIYIIFVCVIAAFGGLLFGLDQGFMNGSLQLIVKDLHLNVDQASSFAAILLWGSVIGAIISGFVSSLIGRKNTLLLTAIVFTVFSFLSMASSSYETLTIFRFILGLSVGVASFAVPLYLSEIAPTRMRGGFISMYQMMITVGIFAIFVSNYIIGKHTGSWRPMFLAIAIPALIMLVGLIFIPKSPRWLFLKKRHKDAELVLNKTRFTQEEVDFELAEMKEAIEMNDSEKGGFFSMLKHSYFFKVLALGVVIQMFQQLTGINSVIYYSTSIFIGAGLDSPLIATIIVGLVNMLTTILAVLFVDKLGRKPILYFGYTIMALSLFLCSWIFHLESGSEALSGLSKISLVGSTVVFIFAFAISAGPIAWVLCAEIFPLKGRDLGMTVTTAVNWVFAALVVAFSLPMMQLADGSTNSAGGAKLFLFFGICCVIFLFVLKFFIPETKGISLEEVEENLKSNKKLKNIGV